MEKKTVEMDKGLLSLMIQELDGNPHRKFNTAFALMSIIPFLVFLYLLVGRLFTLDILSGNIGFIVAIAAFISVCGFCIGYSIINRILNKVIFYAAQAKHSDQLKSTFVANVSHELKNPLSVIEVNVFNLIKGLAGKVTENQKKVLDLCRDVVSRMVNLINSLLDLHKIEAGMAEGKRELCNFIQILDEQVKEFNAIFSKKHIKLEKEISSTDLALWGDREKIGRIINNLLGNAVKYTPDGGAVNLKVLPDNNLLRIECANDGPSIPAEKLAKIFDKFERANLSEEGSGLGLAITKDIVEFHKGKIWVEDWVGKGSKFIVLLPRDLRRGKR